MVAVAGTVTDATRSLSTFDIENDIKYIFLHHFRPNILAF